MWIDQVGNVNIFAGRGYDYNNRPNPDPLSDMWSYDGVHWIWVSGPRVRNELAVYGDLGVSSKESNPPAIGCMSTWLVDDTLYLFAGASYFELSFQGNLNKLSLLTILFD